MKIISHSADADGRVSAFLVAKKFGITDPNDFIMTDYGKGSDFISTSVIKPGEKVVICDFSFENGPEDMKKLMKITKDITWIDHHASSIKKYGDFGKDIPGLRIDGTAACMLTYIYYYLSDTVDISNLTQQKCEELYKYAPLLVRYTHDHDVWRHEYRDTEAFNTGLYAKNLLSPLDEEYEKLFTDIDEVNSVIFIGNISMRYRDSLASSALNEAFEYTLNGKHGLFLNMILGGSQWFLDKMKEYDFVCSFNYRSDGKWEYNFYSDSDKGANCYELAQFVDPKGGGHVHAAGCVTNKFIIKR